MAWIQISTDSAALNMQVEIQVIYPQAGAPGNRGGYAASGPYSTLYLLHGLGGDGTEWLRNTSVERYLGGKSLAAVLPDGINSWWRTLDSGFAFFDYYTDELPRKVEGWFNLSAKPEDRYIGGISMGGYGAIHAALTKPDMYAKVFALSAVIDAPAFVNSVNPDMSHQVFGNEDERHDNGADLYALAERCVSRHLPLPQVYLSCGKDDPLFPANAAYAEYLKKLGFSVTWNAEDGVHDWTYGDQAIQGAISWLGRGRDEWR